MYNFNCVSLQLSCVNLDRTCTLALVPLSVSSQFGRTLDQCFMLSCSTGAWLDCVDLHQDLHQALVHHCMYHCIMLDCVDLQPALVPLIAPHSIVSARTIIAVLPNANLRLSPFLQPAPLSYHDTLEDVTTTFRIKLSVIFLFQSLNLRVL